MVVLGFDVGGAHLKVARIENARVVGATEIACPLWQGMDRLDAALAEARVRLGEAPKNAVTMTGELCDIFPARAEGVARISEKLRTLLAGEIHVYAGAKGWLSTAAAAANAESVASA